MLRGHHVDVDNQTTMAILGMLDLEVDAVMQKTFRPLRIRE
jgi:hypothetical protein